MAWRNAADCVKASPSQMCIRDRRVGGTVDALTEIAEHPAHFMGVRPRSQNAILRTLELRGRDHFHGLGNLLRILEGGDFPPERL